MSAERRCSGCPAAPARPRSTASTGCCERLVAGLPVGAARDHAHGRGGLLAEIPSRPLPRAEATPRPSRGAAATPHGPRIAALLLAAGQSRRMGGPNKLLDRDRRHADGGARRRRRCSPRGRGRSSRCSAIRPTRSTRRSASLPVERVRNPGLRRRALDLAEARHRRAAARSSTARWSASATCRWSPAGDIDRLIAAFNPLEGRAIIVPTRRGKRGNPVLWAKRFFPEMAELAGDVGAKHLIGEHAELVAEVEMDDDGVLSTSTRRRRSPASPERRRSTRKKRGINSSRPRCLANR